MNHFLQFRFFLSMLENKILKAQKILVNGGVIALPTETVYGLAANAYDASAVKRIFTIKKRPLTSPLIVHTSHLDRAKLLVKSMPEKAIILAETFWPGPLTLLLEKKASLPDIVNAGLAEVGIRVPSHPVAQMLLEKLPFPLAAPSANPFGYISPTTAQHVEAQLGKKVDYILDGGRCTRGLESTIVGFSNKKPVIYRLGSITQEEIEKVIGPAPYLPPIQKDKSIQLTPGRSERHYSPHTPILVGDLPSLLRNLRNHRVVALCFDTSLDDLSVAHQVVLSPKKSLEEAAHKLFDALHHLDMLGADFIIAPYFPEEGLGRVMNERLLRASTQP